MFNKNFYPTPEAGCLALVAGIDRKHLAGKTILEPSAGKGDILDFIKERQGKYSKVEFICLEIEPELTSILHNKGYKVIGADFLNTPIHYDVDYIFMNPPFDQGAKHLLRAWEVINSGTIRCLLNAETYNNPYTKEREILVDLIGQHGNVTNLGKVFSNAERKTNVEVVMVELIKEQKESFNFDVDFEAESHQMKEDFDSIGEVVLHDMLNSREARYNASIEAYKDFIKAKEKFLSYASPLVSEYAVSHYPSKSSFNEFVQDFNADAWDKLLTESKFADLLTKRVRDEFIYKQFPRQKNVAFTKRNMVELLSILMGNKGAIIDKCVLDVFDLLTRYHKENRVHIEGWKTNEAYKVGMKFILPRVMKEYDPIFGTYSFDYQNEYILNDIDIVMCFLTGHKLSSIETCYEVLKEQFQNYKDGKPFSTKLESTFFEIKFFKKGTIHFKFKSKQLWQWFNCRASELRGFPLPESKEVYSKQLTL